MERHLEGRLDAIHGERVEPNILHLVVRKTEAQKEDWKQRRISCSASRGQKDGSVRRVGNRDVSLVLHIVVRETEVSGG